MDTLSSGDKLGGDAQEPVVFILFDCHLQTVYSSSPLDLCYIITNNSKWFLGNLIIPFRPWWAQIGELPEVHWFAGLFSRVRISRDWHAKERGHAQRAWRHQGQRPMQVCSRYLKSCK